MLIHGEKRPGGHEIPLVVLTITVPRVNIIWFSDLTEDEILPSDLCIPLVLADACLVSSVCVCRADVAREFGGPPAVGRFTHIYH
jgi:hypothetical protein